MTEAQRKLCERIRISVYIGGLPSDKMVRKTAWLCMLGIDPNGSEVAAYRDFYKMFLKEKAEPKTKQAGIENLILKDVNRTFAGLKLFDQNPAGGMN